jgi:hypothetical protein
VLRAHSALVGYLHYLRITDSVGTRPVSRPKFNATLGEKTLYYCDVMTLVSLAAPRNKGVK